jgi:lipoprotein-anchoring transpeptidase ErfK/SrfK
MRRAVGTLLLIVTTVACSGAPRPVPTESARAGIPTPSPSRSADPARSLPASPSVSSSAAPSSTRRTCEARTLIGRVTAPSVAARREPRPAAATVATFRRVNPQGSPQVFDLLGKVAGTDGRTWYRALLPVRPNGTTGFVPASALSVSFTTYRLEVDRHAFRLTLLDGCRTLATFPVGIGTGDTPTPNGRFYLASLMQPPTPDSVYGAYAYGLSAFSNVLLDWEAGGIIGLHGTNDPASIGHQASHGCIRMRNRDITRLVKILPLGTPIAIH